MKKLFNKKQLSIAMSCFQIETKEPAISVSSIWEGFSTSFKTIIPNTVYFLFDSSHRQYNSALDLSAFDEFAGVLVLSEHELASVEDGYDSFVNVNHNTTDAFSVNYCNKSKTSNSCINTYGQVLDTMLLAHIWLTSTVNRTYQTCKSDLFSTENVTSSSFFKWRTEMLNESLKSIRQFNRLTQTELSKALKVSRSTISDVESGRRPPTLKLLQCYSDYFKMPVSDIHLLSEGLDKSNSFFTGTAMKILKWIASDDSDPVANKDVGGGTGSHSGKLKQKDKAVIV